MAKDLSKIPWHGVPREEIPWYPSVNADACIGCELCYLTCGREVYEMVFTDAKHQKAIAERSYNCMVGCSTCAVVCPTQAITFPSREVVWKVERQFKIFKTVRTEAKEKRQKSATLTNRQEAEKQIGRAITRVHVMIAGVFGEKRFLTKLQEFIKDKPCDIENIQLSVPTLKGLMEKAPAHMSLDLTSTTQEDVHRYLDELRKLVVKNELVWVEEK